MLFYPPQMEERSAQPVTLLDGDVVRTHL